MTSIYVASSWRNKYQPDVVAMLREAGHDVYDFRKPEPGVHGFHWSAIDPAWEVWDYPEYFRALRHPIAESGFAKDFNAMERSSVCVLVLPSGRSAHLEAGYMAGQGKTVIVYIPEYDTPDLMYKLAGYIVAERGDLLSLLSEAQP